MIKSGFETQSGKSVIELIIVLVILTIVVTFAVARFGNSKTVFNRENLAREFKVNLERARFDAVKRRADAANGAGLSKVVIESATSFKTSIDFDQNGIIDSTDVRTVNFVTGDVKFVGTDLIYPITITFDRFGQAISKNASHVNVKTFTICDSGCTTTNLTPNNSNIISLSSNGTVAMLKGGQTVPTFANPTVSTVPSDSDIDRWLVVYDTTTPTIVIPDSTSGTTNYCSRNEKPSVTGCTCQLPMTVGSSGQCK
jgi:Tfp pilus assembly protein FimT